MGMSRKRTRELKKLKGQAAGVWDEQREVLGHAGKFWHDAGTEAAYLAVNDVAPRVRATLEHQVKPAVSTSVANASVAAAHAKDRIVNDVAPAIVAAVQSSPLSDFMNDPAVSDLVNHGKKLGKKAKRKALKKAAKQAAKHPRATVKVAKAAHSMQKHHKSGVGAGGVFLIIVGLIGVGAVVYAAIQTLRADDELWVADDDESSPAKA